MSYFICRRAFRDAEGPVPVGSVVDPTGIKRFRFRLQEKHMSTALSNRARQQYNQYIERQAQLHGTDIATITRGVKYAIDPSVEQKLESAVQESSAFLQKINIFIFQLAENFD